MTHWAAHLIGRPWTRNFNCWALVIEVFRLRWGIAMPDVLADDQGGAIAAAAEVSGWRPAAGPGQDGDIVVMRGPSGRHVGVLIDTARGLRLLHCAGGMTPRGPTGCVVAQTLAEATREGYHDLSFWRRGCNL